MPEHRYHKGDCVAFQFGPRSLQGCVKEDRGPIGVKGRRLYLVEFYFGHDLTSPSQIELPAEDLRLVQEEVTKE